MNAGVKDTGLLEFGPWQHYGVFFGRKCIRIGFHATKPFSGRNEN